MQRARAEDEQPEKASVILVSVPKASLKRAQSYPFYSSHAVTNLCPEDTGGFFLKLHLLSGVTT